jgi:hypothetical protein
MLLYKFKKGISFGDKNAGVNAMLVSMQSTPQNLVPNGYFELGTCPTDIKVSM